MLALLLLLTGQAGPSSAPMIPAFFTGESLYQICRRPNSGQCSMYVAGVLDGIFFARSRFGQPLCPSRMTNREAAETVTAYLASHAEARRLAASVVVRHALAPRLDCDPDNPGRAPVGD